MSDTAQTASRSRAWVGLGLLAVLTLAVYAPALRGPFVFDDIASIVENPTVRRLWPLTDVLSPPHASGATVGGRPLLNLSFALNRTLSGESPLGFHLANVLLHLANGLLLFGIVRRALSRVGRSDGRADAGAAAMALGVTALWLLHPLQTESVAYIAQRAEALASFFYLATLYAFVRAADPLAQPAASRTRIWFSISVIACVLGMASKETMVTAPVLVLLFDRTFAAGSFAAAWRLRRAYYLALAGTWAILVALLLQSGGARGDTAGLHTGVSPFSYALTQAAAIVHYVRLSLWPAPLIFDYGDPVVQHVTDVRPQLAAIGAALLVTLLALRRKPPLGFALAAFFLLLAPSSSVVPIASQTIAEHRMYLALAPLLALGLFGLRASFGRAAVPLALLVAIAAAGATYRRAGVYASALALWSDTTARAPENARAHNNLGNALLAHGQRPAAIAEYQAALRLRPDYADAQNNLGRALLDDGRPVDALPHLDAARRAKPQSIDVLANYGSALAQTGRVGDALSVYARALELAPDAIAPRFNRANALLRRGDFAAAAADYERVLRLAPQHSAARFNLAKALTGLGRLDDAVQQYENLLRLAPRDAAAHAELANLLAHLGRRAEAFTHYDEALRLQPDFEAARQQLRYLQSTPAGAQAK